MVVASEALIEREVFGVTYERFALQKLCARLVKKLGITSVLELPAGGAKAMPGLYSLGFALAGCDVTLVGADCEALNIWRKLGLESKLSYLNSAEISAAAQHQRRWDLVWNFAVLPAVEDPSALLSEMAGFSRRWLMVAAVNRFNVGFNLHRTVHWVYRIPWSHGDVRYFSPFYTRRFLQDQGCSKVRWGVIDCPPWPDSPGFRDLRLHRQGDQPKQWESPYIEHLHRGRFPSWLRYVYWGERFPLPPLLKLPYAHLYYSLGRVADEIPR
jgi:hypothetical protein